MALDHVDGGVRAQPELLQAAAYLPFTINPQLNPLIPQNAILIHMASQSTSWYRLSTPIPRRLGETNFRYKDLDPLQDEIRLLRVLPGQAHNAIECEMLHASAEGPQRYIALSYAWGDVEDTGLIILNGYEFPVTQSLWGALQRLRSESFAKIVWADAICINQQSPIERSIQVRKMTSIYSNAYDVAIWLGAEGDNSNKALELISDILESRNSVATINEIITSPARTEQFRGVVELFERDYWRRLWCVQEVFNAKSVTVYCGSQTTSWEAYTSVQRVLKQYSSQLLRRFPENYVLSSYRKLWSTVLCNHGPSNMGYQNRPNESSNLLRILLSHREKLCVEPRDRVYAVLGLLAAHERSQFPIDYNVSVREIFTHVVDYVLRITQRLDVICATIHFPLHPNRFSLPSWASHFSFWSTFKHLIVSALSWDARSIYAKAILDISYITLRIFVRNRTLLLTCQFSKVPNWDNYPEVIPIGYRYTEFAAAGRTKARFSFSNKRSTLSLSGVFIDHVVMAGLTVGFPVSTDNILMAFHHWRMKLIQRVGLNVSMHEAFCRTVCLDQAKERWTSREWLHWTYHSMARLTEERVPAMPVDPQLAEFETYAPEMSDGLRLQLFEEFLVEAVAGRTFLITGSGLLCLGSGYAEFEDCICVLLGCSSPVILRKHKDYYEYVGDVYVDGYMHGKAIDELNNGTRQLQSFDLR